MNDDPKHWRQRAQEARAAVAELDDPESKKTMTEIAEAYERLAALAQSKTAPKASR